MSESQEKTGITDAFTEAMKTGDFSTLNEKLNSLADTAIEVPALLSAAERRRSRSIRIHRKKNRNAGWKPSASASCRR